MKNELFPQAFELHHRKAYRDAAAAFRVEALRYTANISDGWMKDLDAAEAAAIAWVGCIQSMMLLPDEEWSDADHDTTREYINDLLAVGKLIKKRYETKVFILIHAARFLYVLGEEEQAQKHLSAASRFYDQQLAYLAEPPFARETVVHLQTLKAELEEELRSSRSSLQQQTVKVTIEATSTADMELALEALRQANSAWVVPKTYRERRTSKDPRAGRRFYTTVQLTSKPR